MPPPPGKLSFAMLCEHVGASPNTVRSVVEHLRIVPERPGGNVTWYAAADADRVKAHYHAHGGYYRPVSKSHSQRAGRY